MNVQTLLDIKQKLFEKSQSLTRTKGHDYSSADPKEDTFRNLRASNILGIAPEKAILIRMLDKVMRVSNYIDEGNFAVRETLEDTIIDIINYSTYIYAMVEEHKYQNE